MVRSKSAASWTIDNDILAWIDTKLGSKSEFVNRVLLTRMKNELGARVMDTRPKCSLCNIAMRPDKVHGNGYLCSNIHCGGV